MREPFCGARTCLMAFIIAEILICSVIFVATLIFYWILASYLVRRFQTVLYSLLFNFYIVALQLIALYVISLLLWRRLWNMPVTRDLQLFIKLWLLICLTLIICCFGTTWSVSTCADELEASTETAMLNGIDTYYTSPEWKLLWDELQYTKQCCGGNCYLDWMDACWMSDIAHPDFRATEMTYAPYACCRQGCSNCSDKYSPTAQNVAKLSISLINTGGCLPLFMKNFWRLVYIVFGLLMIVLKLQIFIWALVRFTLQRQDGEGQWNLSGGEQPSNIKIASSISCTDPDLEAQDVLEVCSCGKVLKRDEDCYQNCTADSSNEDMCLCSSAEIIH